MKDPKRFYTYAYLRENRIPYYIGKGEGGRVYSKNHRVSVPPAERIIFLKKNLLEEDAIKHEKYMINVFGRIDNRTGVLANLTDGGIATSGYIRTEEQKEYLRNLWKGDKSPMYGVPKSPEIRRKMSEAQLGEKNHRYGKTLTEEERKQMSERMLGRECPSSRRKHTKEETEKRMQKMRGRKWWNNGKEDRFLYEPLDETWTLGRISKTLPQVWEVISPDGIVYIINNLSLFCKQRFNKNTSVLANVAYGVRKHYTGWKCRKLTKYEYA